MEGSKKEMQLCEELCSQKVLLSLVFSGFLSLLPILSFLPFAMNVALTPGINPAQLPNFIIDFVRLLFSYQVGDFKWLKWVSNLRQKINKQKPQTNKKEKNPSVWQHREMWRSRQGTRTFKSKAALQDAHHVIRIWVLGCLIARQKKVHRKGKSQQKHWRF